jgi:hypothetical protein
MIACGHYPAFSRAQGVDNIHPGDRPGTGAIAQKSPALSPRCTQIPGVFAQVIHKFAHREARLAEAPTGNRLPASKTQRARVRGPAPAAHGDLGQGRQAAASARGRACRSELTGGLPPAGDLGSEHGLSPQRTHQQLPCRSRRAFATQRPVQGMSEPVSGHCPARALQASRLGLR